MTFKRTGGKESGVLFIKGRGRNEITYGIGVTRTERSTPGVFRSETKRAAGYATGATESTD